MGLLEGKRALVVGVASNRSIAWGIAQALHREGAQLAFTYQNEKLRERVENFANELNSEITVPCEVTDDKQIQEVFEHLDDYWDSLDILIHSVAYAPKEQLEGDYLENVTAQVFGLPAGTRNQFLQFFGPGGRCSPHDAKPAGCHVDPYLHRCCARHAQLQCHGCCQSQFRGQHALYGFQSRP